MIDTLPSLSIFLPAYNEEDNIRASVEKAICAAEKVADRYEIIVVNDASTDRTAEIVEHLEQTHPGIVRLVTHEHNLGYGGALTTGINESRYDFIFFTDADLQFDLEEIVRLTEHAQEYDAVIGCRKKRQDPFIRLVNAKGWNILNRILFGLKVKDIDCAFKLMRRSIVTRLPIQSQGAMVSAEMLILMKQQGARIKEVDVTHFPRTSGSPTGAHPKVILRAFREMFRVFMSEVGRPTRVQLFTFGLIGVLNTLVDFAAYYFLTRHSLYFTDHYVFAKVTSFFLGTVTSFIFNKFITFEQREWSVVEILRFYTVVSVSLVVNAVFTYLFTSVFGFFDLLSVVLATIITLFINFVGSKLFVFDTTRSDLHVSRQFNVQAR